MSTITTDLAALTFGIEIETVGQTRPVVCDAIKSVVGGRIEHTGGYYDVYTVVADDGRKWKAMTDASLSASTTYQAEVVSPILHYGDIETVQNVVRAIRTQAHARVDSSCGIHIHVGSRSFSPNALRNLVKIVNKQEALIEHALGTSNRSRWCRSIDSAFLARIEAQRPSNLDDINAAWYGYHNYHPTHYDQTRYHGLNLHNVWFRGTVEFRWFAGTLHAGKVKAYIQFILALCNKAIKARSASAKKRTLNTATAKYDFRVFLLNLGLIGDEFKTCRLHLMAKLSGSAAWRNGRRDGANASANTNA